MGTRFGQRGMTAIGWLIVLGLVAFFALLVLRLTPVYLEHYKVTSALQSLHEEPFITRKDPSEIMKLLMRRLDIDDVDRVKRDNVKIENQQGKLTIRVTYEVRIPMIANVDAVVSFDDSEEFVAQ
ncbi:MAG: DUF4845 domain-containing protein [Gammaproteobacteria bacterium]|nr:DUF4845 domain-containing protein [Gammaproteobacteria bacterium]